MSNISASLIFGKAVLAETVAATREVIRAHGGDRYVNNELPSCRILLFQDMTKPERYHAAKMSMQHKFLFFSRAGINTQIGSYLARDVKRFAEEDVSTILGYDDPSVNTILQQPLPPKVLEVIKERSTNLSNFKQDLDISSPDCPGIPAVCEAAFRLVQGSYKPGKTIGLIGSKGYFGLLLGSLMSSASMKWIGYDLGDSLSMLNEADVLISCAGSPGILNKNNLKPHHTVIDIGFSPTDASYSAFCGDVSKDCRHIPKALTPVPGGIGPLQIAILIERYVRKNMDPLFSSWYLDPNSSDIIFRRKSGGADIPSLQLSPS